jgi:hypothetical protein
MSTRMDAAISALAQAIAADSSGNFSHDAVSAWAVQHINAVALQRNPFSGLTGITAEHAEAGLADYLTDHKQWNRRIYDAELAAGLRRCMRATSKGLVAPGSLVHDVGNAEYMEAMLAKGYADAAYPLGECPRKHEHRSV